MRIRKVVVAIFAVIGAYVIFSLVLTSILSKKENTCSIFWSKEYPSPGGLYRVVDNLANCGGNIYKRQIELHGEKDKKGIPIIYLSDTGAITRNGVSYSPPPVGVAWDGDFKIILRTADEKPKFIEKYGEISVDHQNIFQ